jgi:outer membrane beta-barrel protein
MNPYFTFSFFAVLTVSLAGSGAAVGAKDEDGIEVTATTVTQQETRAKTLAERIPAVSARAFSKAGRFEFYPELGMSLNDPFFDYAMIGAGAAYNVLETLAIGVSGEYYLASSTSVPVVGVGQINAPDYNRPAYAGRLELMWVPLYGKISLLAEKVLHFDAYLGLGGSAIGLNLTGTTYGPSAVLGGHLVLNDAVALRAELRDQSFRLERDAAAHTGRSLMNLLSASVGVCFYLPTSFERTGI